MHPPNIHNQATALVFRRFLIRINSAHALKHAGGRLTSIQRAFAAHHAAHAVANSRRISLSTNLHRLSSSAILIRKVEFRMERQKTSGLSD